jgi:hypothetical protein
MVEAQGGAAKLLIGDEARAFGKQVAGVDEHGGSIHDGRRLLANDGSVSSEIEPLRLALQLIAPLQATWFTKAPCRSGPA